MKKTVLILIAAATMLSAGLASGCGDSQKFAGTPEEISFGSVPNVLATLVIVARDQGFFAQEGLVIAFRDYPSGKRAFVDGFLTGEIDVLTSSGVPIVINSFERQDYSIVATVGQSDDVARIIARRDRGIRQPEDLRGKKVATQFGSAVHFFLDLFLADNGLSIDDIELVDMEAEKLPGALASGEIDAFCMREPFVEQAEELLGANAVLFAESGLFLKTHNLVVRNSLIRDKPETVKRMLKALLKAEQFVESYPERAIAIVAADLGIEELAVASPLLKIMPRLSLDQSLLLELEDEARWAIQEDLAAGTDIPNYLDYVYIDALAEIKPDAVTIIR